MLRQTLHYLCEKGEKLRDCLLPQDVHSVVESFLDGSSVELDCGEVLGNIDDAMDMLAAQEGCLTHSKGMTFMIKNVKNQSQDCAGFMMKKALEGRMTQKRCSKVALHALKIVAGSNVQDPLCHEYVCEEPNL